MTPTFFSQDRNDSAHAEEFKHFLPVNVNTAFDTLAPALGDAEHKYVRSLLGDQLWNELADYYAQSLSDNPVKTALVERIQSAVIRIAYYENFSLLAVTLTDSGVQDANGEYRAYRYQVESARDTLGRQAFEHLQYLYDAVADSGIRVWAPDDPYNPRRSNTLFPTPSDFFVTVDMMPDYRLFARLRQQLTMTETVALPYIIGSTLATALLSLPSSGRMADPVVVSLARRFVAFRCLADAILLLNAYISSDGATLRTLKAEGSVGGSQVSPADTALRQQLQNNYLTAANAASTDLLSYLRSHLDLYPELSEVVGIDTNIKSRTPDNTGLKHTFRV